MDRSVVLIVHNIRSCHNVGSILRTAEGLAINTVYLTGYTPYPVIKDNDRRLPHERAKIEQQINKTALGAQKSVNWVHALDVSDLINQLRFEHFIIIALEQTKNSVTIVDYKPLQKTAIILGSEVEGIEADIIKQADLCLQIPMFGKKESYNVCEAATMAMYHFRFR